MGPSVPLWLRLGQSLEERPWRTVSRFEGPAGALKSGGDSGALTHEEKRGTVGGITVPRSRKPARRQARIARRLSGAGSAWIRVTEPSRKSSATKLAMRGVPCPCPRRPTAAMNRSIPRAPGSALERALARPPASDVRAGEPLVKARQVRRRERPKRPGRSGVHGCYANPRFDRPPRQLNVLRFFRPSRTLGRHSCAPQPEALNFRVHFYAPPLLHQDLRLPDERVRLRPHGGRAARGRRASPRPMTRPRPTCCS